MTITFHDTYLYLKSSYIDEIIAAPTDYVKVEIAGDINCCTSNCGEQKTLLTILLPQTLDTDKAEFTADGIKIYPLFFGLTAFIDGIYNFSVKRFEDEQGTVTEDNCLFVDLTYKCKVATLLKCIIEENKKQSTEKISTVIHVLHYSLVNGSNCGCNCTEMCEIFRELTTLLANVDPQITNDCGC